jgi:DNA-directed RNA polymerase specialized sigma54-like protein
MKHAVGRLPVYESLHALNHNFEQVLSELARLQELGMFNRDLANILRIVVQETRAWANFELVEILQLREQDDWTHFGRLHRRWEKKLQDPNDVLIEAKLLMEKRRKAAGKKGGRKRRGAGSEGV